MRINTEYNLGDKVYLKTDIEQKVRIVSGFVVRDSGIIYYLSCGEQETQHYFFEISEEKDVIMTTTN